MERGTSQTDARALGHATEDVLLGWAEAFLGARVETVVEVIETGLRQIAEAVGARGAVAFQMAGDGSYVEAVYQWRAPGLVSMREARYHASEIADTFAAFLRGEPVVVRTDQVADGHHTLRAVMMEQGSTGTMAFPIQEGGATTWVLGGALLLAVAAAAWFLLRRKSAP